LLFCENEATIDYNRDNYHHGSAVNLRNTCRRNLTQRLVSWYNPVVPKVCIETRTWVAKGLKMGRTEVIQTGVVCFQSYQCLYVCGWGTWEKSRLV